MKNREKYKDEILEAMKKLRLSGFMDNHVTDYCKSDPAFYNQIRFIFWLDEECTEPEVDWSQVEDNAPIFVSDDKDAITIPAHFAGYDSEIIHAYVHGKTSHTTYGRDQCHEETMRLAAAALEKQIPEKIEVWNGAYSCPACEILFGPKDLMDIQTGAKRNYCHHCGQAIDWSNAK